MAQRVDSFDIGALRLTPGEARTIEAEVQVDELVFGGERYRAEGAATARLDISRTTSGYALRIRMPIALRGPCMRCLEESRTNVDVDAREVDQPGDSEQLRSPYVEEDVVNVGAWARDALALALPVQILCSEECRGLCTVCGANLNEDPGHAHERPPDPRWAKLAELKLDE